MKGPQITKKIGTIQADNRIYIEDYVYSFLEQRAKEGKEEQIVLFGHCGKIEQDPDAAVMIYGAALVDELTEEETYIFREYERVGIVDMKKWVVSASKTGGIRLENPDPVEGYYVFCESNESMKEYMNLYYRKQLRRQNMNRTSLTAAEEKYVKGRSGESIEHNARAERNERTERNARTDRDERADRNERINRNARTGERKTHERIEELPEELVSVETDGFFDLIRAVVILIFIFLCAIAVGTINTYDKMQDFTEAAAGAEAYEESDE